jgi:hypothetical protein
MDIKYRNNTMTPKEKAEELLGKYLAIQFGDFPTTDAKQCALIAVDEIINSNYKNTLNDLGYRYTVNELNDYWHEVKQEIEKL